MNSIIDCDEYTAIINENTETQFIDIETKKPLFTNLPLSIVVDYPKLQKLISDITTTNVSVAEEGTTIRVFWNRGRWYTATKRKLQAFRSNWADKSRTFGATFAQAIRNELDAQEDDQADQEFLESFYNQYLDKTKTYFFVLRNTKGERIVCTPPENPKALHICTQVNFTNDFQDKIIINAGAFTHTLHLETSWDVIKQQLSTLNHCEHQGIIIEQAGVFYKLLIPTYARLAALRGTTASLRMRYLELRIPDLHDSRMEFLKLYPEFEEQVEQLEADIYIICCRLHRIYMDKFINKIRVHLTPPTAKAMKVIHQQYLETRLPTTSQRINDALVEHPVIVNHLLKEKKKYDASCK